MNAEETEKQKDQRMQWWREAKFGMFIHWGVYSVPAGTWQGKKIEGIGEWIMNRGKIPVKDYGDFTKEFNPVKYDADQWVRLAKQAGMKYIVITSKHHDGFAMFHSKTSPFNIVDATPFDRDPLKELAEACQEHGLKLGFYYSQAQDWHHPGGSAAGGHWDGAQEGDMAQYIRDIAVPQIKELLTEYGPISVLWWDTPRGMTPEMAEELLPLLDLQPGIIQNNRLGGGFRGDTETPEQFIPARGYPGRDWETCMTINDTWGFKSYDQNWKSTKTLLRNLIDIVSKGGNYLLNVGPTSEGEIPQVSIDRLKDIGEWMDTYHETIYGTSASPFRELPWGRCSRKDNKLFLYVFDVPKNGILALPMKTRIRKAYLFDSPDNPLEARAGTENVEISLPALHAPDIAHVVVVELAGKLETTDHIVRRTYCRGI